MQVLGEIIRRNKTQQQKTLAHMNNFYFFFVAKIFFKKI